MSAKRSRKVLEWVAGSPGVSAGGAPTEELTDRLELGLRDDEIAEIHKIIIGSQIREDFDAGKTLTLIHWLSMDPDSVYSGITLQGDLETIIMATRSHYGKGILVGVECVVPQDKEFIYDFYVPLLVGTDLGMGLFLSSNIGNVDAGNASQFRVFYTRRRASTTELNQILLKRR